MRGPGRGHSTVLERWALSLPSRVAGLPATPPPPTSRGGCAEPGRVWDLPEQGQEECPPRWESAPVSSPGSLHGWIRVRPFSWASCIIVST